MTEEDVDNIPFDDAPFLGEFHNSIVIKKDDVYNKLMDLKPEKSVGLDGWHPLLLKSNCGDTVVVIYTGID